MWPWTNIRSPLHCGLHVQNTAITIPTLHRAVGRMMLSHKLGQRACSPAVLRVCGVSVYINDWKHAGLIPVPDITLDSNHRKTNHIHRPWSSWRHLVDSVHRAKRSESGHKGRNGVQDWGILPGSPAVPATKGGELRKLWGRHCKVRGCFLRLWP